MMTKWNHLKYKVKKWSLKHTDHFLLGLMFAGSFVVAIGVHMILDKG